MTRTAADMALAIAQRPRLEPLETHTTYGARILIFILATGITGVFEDVELETALRASMLAHVNPDLLTPTRATIADTRYMLTLTLEARRKAVAVATRVPPADTKHEGGNAYVRPMGPTPDPQPLTPARVRMEDVF